MTKQEALSFLLTHIVVEKSYHFELNPASLFKLITLADEAEQVINSSEGVIPHEVLEGLAADFTSDGSP
jgi:hypothetical protein